MIVIFYWKDVLQKIFKSFDMLIYLLLAQSKKIIITPYNDYENHLVIVDNLVRMSYEYTDNDEFYVGQEMTTISQGGKNICGKLSDPGVVTCTHQDKRMRFKFVRFNNYENIISDDDLCLTLHRYDNLRSGNFLNLSHCDGSEKQKFMHWRVVNTNEEQLDGTYIPRNQN